MAGPSHRGGPDAGDYESPLLDDDETADITSRFVAGFVEELF